MISLKKMKDFFAAIIREVVFKSDVPYMVEQRNYINPRQKKQFIEMLNCDYPNLFIKLLEVGSRGGISFSWRPLLNLKNFYLIGIEPDKEEAKALMLQKKFLYKIIYTDAIYSKKAKIPLFITKALGCTSIYEPNYESLRYYPGTDGFKIQKKIFINVKPLDSVIPKDEKFDFINIDVQGAEYDVIKGGERVFENLVGATLESHLFEYYKGEKLFHEIHGLLKEKFRIIDLTLRSLGGEVSEIGNTVYIRRHDEIKNKDDLIKRILFAVLFSRKEHVEFLLKNYSRLLTNGSYVKICKILKIDTRKRHKKIDFTKDVYYAAKDFTDGSGY